MDDFKRLIGDHVDKKQKAAVERREHADEEKARRDRSRELLTSIVLPELSKCVSEINDTPYSAELRERLEGYEPSVELHVTITTPRNETSTLIFGHPTGKQLRNCIVVTRRVASSRGHKTEIGLPFDKINGAMVRKAALDFVAAVLSTDE